MCFFIVTFKPSMHKKIHYCNAACLFKCLQCRSSAQCLLIPFSFLVNDDITMSIIIDRMCI